MSTCRRILFFGEPATLAHVMRPAVLAKALQAAGHEVAVATGRDYCNFVENEGLAVRDLRAIGTRAYLAAVDAGRVVFPYSTLDGYVQEDLRHIEAFHPDLVVGDFRLSLAVSARLAKVPYLGLSNAYWSPCVDARYDIPVHPATKLLGPALPNALFQLLRPVILAHHSVPMHRLRKRYGMRSLGLDLRAVFTEADVTAYADVPALVPGAECGNAVRYRYIGPVLWSAPGALPAEFRDACSDKPWVYVSMGSSGDPRLVTQLLAALEGVHCRIAVATAGAVPASAIPPGVLAADYMPGDQAAARARLVICNGGSPGAHQALAQGTPVLGIPANLDQMLNMHFVSRFGAGVTLRADDVRRERVRNIVNEMLNMPVYSERAQAVASAFREYHAASRFASIVDELAS
jgi:UDP:flavonoid glycosyltransferase YjiC (YdhE family)